MRPEQLPLDDRYFTKDNDYRPLLRVLGHDIHAIMNYRRPSRKSLKRMKAAKKTLGLCKPILENLGLQNCHDFEHVSVVINTDGVCFLGETKTNLQEGDQYNRKYGFRLAIKKALDKMAATSDDGGRTIPFDFDIGIEPPFGKLLSVLIKAKLEQFKIL